MFKQISSPMTRLNLLHLYLRILLQVWRRGRSSQEEEENSDAVREFLSKH
jgi:hypothetical protein